jgi:hypothetical protein
MKLAMKLGSLSIALSAMVAFATAAQPAVQPANQPTEVKPALAILAPPIAQRVAQSTTIVVGKVESIEEKTVQAKQYPAAQDKAEFQIAIIKIEDPILVEKGLTHVRVGFLPPPPARVNPGGPNVGPIVRPPIGAPKPVNFVKDQEVLVFLAPHFDGNFMYAQNGFDVVDKQGNANFEKDVAEAKKFAKLLADPKEGLKSDKQEERYSTAAMLIMHYRFKRIGGTEPKTEAVNADISKLILTALAESDWTNAATPIPRTTPQNLFMQLGVTDKDGWKPPMIEVQGRTQIDYKNQPAAMQQWCKDNADKYKIQRYVYEKTEKSDK